MYEGLPQTNSVYIPNFVVKYKYNFVLRKNTRFEIGFVFRLLRNLQLLCLSGKDLV